MKRVRKCPHCGRYTLEGTCPECGASTGSPDPPRYSPQDRWSGYRRALIKENKDRRSKDNG